MHPTSTPLLTALTMRLPSTVSTPSLLVGALITAASMPTALGCACGCGVFDVGTDAMLPSRTGLMVSLEYNYQDQDRNWSGSSRAPAANNDDKDITTHATTVGIQYLFNRSWGVQAEVPYLVRSFTSDQGGPAPVTFHWSDLGDIRLRGLYTGFSEDLSTGVSLGVKLPTGNFRHEDPRGSIDRDTQLGSGSTDLLLGAWHRHTFLDGAITGILQVNGTIPFLVQDGYRPGFEVDASIGAYYQGWKIGGARVRPLLQFIGSERTHDSGANSSPDDTGYQRLLVAPGFEIDAHPLHVFASVGLPVYQHMSGNQLVSPLLLKVVANYMF